MTRPGHVPITRMRFRGRGPTLRAMCAVFRTRPGVGLSAVEIAHEGKLDFRDVHQRLADTPELFVRLPRQADGNVKYRLASSLHALGAEDISRFIDRETRIESRIAAIILAVFALVISVTLALSLKY
jgi:hypothetical protein